MLTYQLLLPIGLGVASAAWTADTTGVWTGEFTQRIPMIVSDVVGVTRICGHECLMDKREARRRPLLDYEFTYANDVVLLLTKFTISSASKKGLVSREICKLRE